MNNKYIRIVNREFEKSSFWLIFIDLLFIVLMVVIFILFSLESILGFVE